MNNTPTLIRRRLGVILLQYRSPDCRVRQRGQDRQVNVQLHAGQLADAQRQERPLVLEDTELRSSAWGE